MWIYVSPRRRTYLFIFYLFNERIQRSRSSLTVKHVQMNNIDRQTDRQMNRIQNTNQAVVDIRLRPRCANRTLNSIYFLRLYDHFSTMTWTDNRCLSVVCTFVHFATRYNSKRLVCFLWMQHIGLYATSLCAFGHVDYSSV